jgi:hypothetical protein
LLPGAATTIPIDGRMTEAKRAAAQSRETWFALVGPSATLVHYVGTSTSLQSVRRRLIYREGVDVAEPPESVQGEIPGVGYELDGWGDVGAGVHSLQATSYLLPAGADVERFMRAQQHPLRVTVHPLAPASEGELRPIK